VCLGNFKQILEIKFKIYGQVTDTKNTKRMRLVYRCASRTDLL